MKILIVDDNQTSLKLLQAQLEAEGYEVFAVVDGVEALALLQRETVDAVISDILMPRMHGYRLCYEVRKDERLCRLPFIFYSSTCTEPADEKLALELSADAFLRKPASVKTILETLGSIPSRHQSAAPLAMGAIDELQLMKEYSERLVVKLEEKQLELQQQTEALQANEARLLLQAMALEAAANAIMITGPGGHILWVNPAFTKLTGYSAEEALGETPRMLKSGKHDQAFYRDFWKTITSGQTWRGAFTNLRKDGSLYYDEHTVTPVRATGGAITHFIGIMQDVSEGKRAQAELENVHKQLLEASRRDGMAEVATGVLHNVGNVLNSVNVGSSCLAESLRRSKAPNLSKVVTLLSEHEHDLGDFLTNDPKGRQLPLYLAQLARHLAEEQASALKELSQLQKNIEHIKDIVAMQQSFAKASGVTETIHVTELVDDALRINSSALSRHDIEVIKEFNDTPLITVEKHKVLQILVNLVSNAKHACDASEAQDKKLTIRTTNGAGSIRVAVCDNGVGILPENLIRMFSHGFTTKKDGHGFGLHSGAIAAKEMGGSLTVHSEGPGLGAVFTLELPCRTP